MTATEEEIRKRNRAKRKIYKVTVRSLLLSSRKGEWVDGSKARERIKTSLVAAGFRPDKAERMKRSLYQKAINFSEKIELRRIRKRVMERVSLAHVGKTVDEINSIVDQIIGAVAKPKKIATVKVDPMAHPEVKAVWDARQAERKRVVKANKLRRKMQY